MCLSVSCFGVCYYACVGWIDLWMVCLIWFFGYFLLFALVMLFILSLDCYEWVLWIY